MGGSEERGRRGGGLLSDCVGQHREGGHLCRGRQIVDARDFYSFYFVVIWSREVASQALVFLFGCNDLYNLHNPNQFSKIIFFSWVLHQSCHFHNERGYPSTKAFQSVFQNNLLGVIQKNVQNQLVFNRNIYPSYKWKKECYLQQSWTMFFMPCFLSTNFSLFVSQTL